MAGSFHDDVGGDPHGQSLDDEGAAAGVGSHKFPLGVNRIGSHVSLVGGEADRLVNLGQLAEVLQAPVHGLVGEFREGFSYFRAPKSCTKIAPGV